MSEYIPDAWVLLKFSSKNAQTLYKILAGWYGGYVGSNSWRMCSGIERIEKIGDIYHIHNYSGSLYICHKDTERFTSLTNSIYQSFVEQAASRPEEYLCIDVDDMAEYYGELESYTK